MTTSTAPSKPDRSSSPRWLPCVAAIALLGAPATPDWAQVPMQQVPVQSAQAAHNQNSPIDPPGSIARLSLIEGAVSYAPGDAGNDNAWSAAQLNRPLTAGDRLWTGEQSRTEMHVGSTAVRLNGQTSLDLLALDDNTTQLRLSQGTVRLRVRQLFEGQRLEVDTPNLAFVISQPGDYRIDANPATNTTRVVAQSGAGVLYGDSGVPINLGNQQQGNFSGTNLTPAAPGASVLDSFDNWAMARDQREDQSVSARYVPRETVGYQQLDNYGDWSEDPSYGAVWLPRAVPANWAPYRAGHWSWIAPWGWTWVDDAPWGFAPFHYGRWAQIGPRWAWVPGRLQPRPVYAPALVAFVGGNSGDVNWNISLGPGGPARPAVGWFPLAPGEAFRPAYRVSPRYVTRINNNIVVNNTVNVTNTTRVYRYQRQPAAVTAIAATDFARGQPVRGNVTLNAADLGRAQVVDGGRGIPQRPDRPARREEPRAVAAALPPPAATARPVVSLRDDRREGRREAREADRQGNLRRDQSGNQSGNQPGNPPARLAMPAAPQVVPAAMPPTAVQRITPPVQDNHAAANDENRLRRDREREQQRTAQRPPEQESIGQRALREQAQRDRGDATPSAPRPQGNDSIEQARREQQRLQQEQQRVQREQVRQADRQQRQNDESIGQRALRDAAARDQQAAKQQEEARQRAQQAQQRAQQAQQQNQLQNQQQAQEKNQQRQAHEQAQRQQQEQRKQQQQQASEERQQSRKAEAPGREARTDGPAPPNRQ